MILDIFNKPLEMKIDGRVYKLEYDNKAYIELEHKTGKGTFEIFDRVTNAAMGLEECMHIAVCALMKHHFKDEADELQEILMQKPYLLVENSAVISGAFIMPLMSPEIIQKVSNDKTEAQDSEKKPQATV